MNDFISVCVNKGGYKIWVFVNIFWMCVCKKYIYILKYDNNYIELYRKIINKKN